MFSFLPLLGNFRNLQAICLRLLYYSRPFPSSLHWWQRGHGNVIVTTILGVAQSAGLQHVGSNVDVFTKGHGLAVDGQLAAVMMKIALEVTTARAPAKWAAGIVVDIRE